MSSDNREQFHDLTRKILELLVAACPMPVKINADTFGFPKGSFNETQANGFIAFSGSYIETPEEEFLDRTLQWLTAEGFIRAGESEHYVATLQTLKRFNSVPNTIRE
ncbi:hypothetical protein [Pseudomonas chlororaphis]|uniref:hypothetical protein n=1 Tax=Pseudomonas chlororaphis TaxID=587753 RepID=UPI0039E0E48E